MRIVVSDEAALPQVTVSRCDTDRIYAFKAQSRFVFKLHRLPSDMFVWTSMHGSRINWGGLQYTSLALAMKDVEGDGVVYEFESLPEFAKWLAEVAR